MLRLFYIFLIISSSCNAYAAEDLLVDPVTNEKKLLGPASVQYDQIIHPKPDQTGGLQKAAGLTMSLSVKIGNIPIAINRTDLNAYRGPDVLNSCAYFRSSLVDVSDPVTCCKMLAVINNQPANCSSSTSTGNGPPKVCTKTQIDDQGCVDTPHYQIDGVTLDHYTCDCPKTCPDGTDPNAVQLDTGTNQCINPCSGIKDCLDQTITCTPRSSGGYNQFVCDCPSGQQYDAYNPTCNPPPTTKTVYMMVPAGPDGNWSCIGQTSIGNNPLEETSAYNYGTNDWPYVQCMGGTTKTLSTSSPFNPCWYDAKKSIPVTGCTCKYRVADYPNGPPNPPYTSCVSY